MKVQNSPIGKKRIVVSMKVQNSPIGKKRIVV
jgi:hypothetical protein